jgi:hypothetical protein
MMNRDPSHVVQRLNFLLLKLPATYFLLALGFLVDALVGLPFIISCRLDAWEGRRRSCPGKADGRSAAGDPEDRRQ